MLSVRLAVLSALLLGPSMACAEKAMPMDHHAARSPAEKANAAVMSRMMKAMAVKSTGDADRDFVLMMMPHHQGAIDMARVELQYGKDPALRELAKDVVSAQEKEIELMKAWLAKHGS